MPRSELRGVFIAVREGEFLVSLEPVLHHRSGLNHTVGAGLAIQDKKINWETFKF